MIYDIIHMIHPNTYIIYGRITIKHMYTIHPIRISTLSSTKRRRSSENRKNHLKNCYELLMSPILSPFLFVSLHPPPRSGKSLATTIHVYLARPVKV